LKGERGGGIITAEEQRERRKRREEKTLRELCSLCSSAVMIPPKPDNPPKSGIFIFRAAPGAMKHY
jgi:hypothetical protein